MSTSTTGDDREETVAALLPALAQLDMTATTLEQKSAADAPVTVNDINTYEHQAAHARYLAHSSGATPDEVIDLEKVHRGDGQKGFAPRGLDHATHTRSYAPTHPDHDGKDHDEEEIDL